MLAPHIPSPTCLLSKVSHAPSPLHPSLLETRLVGTGVEVEVDHQEGWRLAGRGGWSLRVEGGGSGGYEGWEWAVR